MAGGLAGAGRVPLGCHQTAGPVLEADRDGAIPVRGRPLSNGVGTWTVGMVGSPLALPAGLAQRVTGNRGESKLKFGRGRESRAVLPSCAPSAHRSWRGSLEDVVRPRVHRRIAFLGPCSTTILLACAKKRDRIARAEFVIRPGHRTGAGSTAARSFDQRIRHVADVAGVMGRQSRSTLVQRRLRAMAGQTAIRPGRFLVQQRSASKIGCAPRARQPYETRPVRVSIGR